MAGRGLERPPLWATILIVVGLVALAVMVPIAVKRGHQVSAATAQTGAAPSSDAGNPLVSGTAGSTSSSTVVEVIGDSYTGGSLQGGNGAAGWPRLMATRLAADGFQVRVVVQAAGGSGYAARGPSGKTFDDLVKQVTASPTVVVFFGSRNDPGKAGVQDAAASTFRDALSRAPKARLLVIGPPWTSANPPTAVRTARDQVQAATAAAGGTFVDPLAAGWFAQGDPTLIGKDGVHPTDAGHQYMAGLIAPQVEQALTAAGAGPAAATASRTSS